MKLQDILDIDLAEFNRLTNEELKEYTKQMAGATRKRVQRLNQKGVTTPASRELERSGGSITVRGKNQSQLRSEFMRAKNFLSAKTGSVTGYNEVKAEFAEAIGLDELTSDQYDNFWRLYDRVKEEYPSFVKGSPKEGDDITSIITAELDDEKDVEQIWSNVDKALTQYYEMTVDEMEDDNKWY